MSTGRRLRRFICTGQSVCWVLQAVCVAMPGVLLLVVEAAASGLTCQDRHWMSAPALQAPSVPQPPQQSSAQQFGSYFPPELPAGSAAQAGPQQSPSTGLPRQVKPRPPGFKARGAPQGAFPVPPPQPAAAAPSESAAAAAAAETQGNAGKARIEDDSPWLASLRCPLTKVGLTEVCSRTSPCPCVACSSQDGARRGCTFLEAPLLHAALPPQGPGLLGQCLHREAVLLLHAGAGI